MNFFVDVKETKELKKLREKAEELHEEAKRIDLDYTYLQNQIRNEVLKDFDAEYDNLRKKLLLMKRDRRKITKKAYNKNAKLRWLRKKKRELWNDVSKAWQKYHKRYEDLADE